MRSQRALLLLQLAGTLALLACGAPNALKAIVLPCWWLLTVNGLRSAELILYFSLCAIFTVMDVLSIKQGLFAFGKPEVLGLSWYEPLMWGFYVLHALRMIKPAAPRGPLHYAAALLVPFCAAFACISDPQVLTAITAGVLGAGLLIFHERDDWLCVLYLMLLGALFEFTGVWSGQWRYTNPPPGGVPLWFIPLWGGVGLFMRRIVLPVQDHLAAALARPLSADTGSVTP